MTDNPQQSIAQNDGDLVRRLTQPGVSGVPYQPLGDLCREAADRIEALERDNTEITEYLNDYRQRAIDSESVVGRLVRACKKEDREAVVELAQALKRANLAEATVAALRERLEDGARPLPFDRDTGGRFVREAWVRWALTQPNPKPSWIIPYDDLSEPDKEVDRQIAEAVARWTLIHDAATLAKGPSQ